VRIAAGYYALHADFKSDCNYDFATYEIRLALRVHVSALNSVFKSRATLTLY
jgi:hypothetical protein